MPTARSGIADGILNGQIFIFGGESPQGTFATNEAFNPATNSWKTYSPMPTARHGLGAATVGQNIYVLGGGLNPGSTDGTANEAFSVP